MVDKRRVRRMTEHQLVPKGPVLYIMGRDQRMRDNWALSYAEELARTTHVPLVVCFVVGPGFLNASGRHADWLVGSLKNVEHECLKRHIPFLIEMGEWAECVVALADRHDATAVVFDHNPLEPVRSWRIRAASLLQRPCMEVDARNIIPAWFLSQKVEWAAYTIRPKIKRLYKEFMQHLPKEVVQPHTYTYASTPIDWSRVRSFRAGESKGSLPTGIIPGSDAGERAMRLFIDTRLSEYATHRNDPLKDATSGLSAYVRWGNISAQRIAHEVERSRTATSEHKEAFLEELVVRRELAENYVLYSDDPTSLDSAPLWALQTLRAHISDVREYTYTYEIFRDGTTHDPLWNAAQQQMVRTGWMHGYMRMYWAKKILEWTATPQEAIEIALRLNDTYQLDGRDSNGVVGVLWSIAGVHDRAWSERPVFGKIRYMNVAGCKRKFDVASYIERFSDQMSLV